MRPLNLNHLTAFHALADAGSVTGAADKLLVSQPAVSKQLKLLEKSLDVTLFERHARGVRLTDAGQVLAGYARRIFSLAAEAEQALADLASLRRGRLALGASPTVGVYLLPPVLVHFRRRFPGVELHLEIENADVLRRRLEEGSVELGLTEVPGESPDLESTPFAADEFVPIAPPDHRLAGKRSASPGDFCREPFVVRQSPSPAGSLVERSLAAAGLAVKPVLSLSSTEAVKQAVAAGLGVAWVSKLAAGPDLAAGRVVAVRVKGMRIERPLYQLRPAGRRQSKALVAFLCLLKHAVRGTLPKIGAEDRRPRADPPAARGMKARSASGRGPTFRLTAPRPPASRPSG